MSRDRRIVAYAWHQRASSIDARERLLDRIPPAPDRLLVATCHRVEVYAVLPVSADPLEWLGGLGVDAVDRAGAAVHSDAGALAHLFAVAAGLDSAVAGEPQVLAQVRRAYRAVAAPHPLLVAAFERALHVGRVVRTVTGLSSARSVGSLAVDAIVAGLADPARASVLVVGAGEMGKLAVRALERRVGRVLVANRDAERATELAAAHHAIAVDLADVARTLPDVDAVVSAADTRGAVLTPAVVAERLRLRRPFAVVDIAVPRSVDAAARALLGVGYRSVDDLPGASARVPEATLREARERCELEALLFHAERLPESVDAIRSLREAAEALRAAKLERALQRLGHLSVRDRRIVEALSMTITNALLHAPTVALRERRADPMAARALFDRGTR